jgi:tetratricopeptide (TPR) repeat protein
LVLFFLVLLGSGAGWAMRDRDARAQEAARDRAGREAKVAGQVELIATEVVQLEREQKWPEALAAARRAEAAVTGGEADPATGQLVRALLKDLEFIDRLEQIRMLRATLVGGEFDDAGADQEYGRAFRDYGVDVEELAVEQAIDRLKTRPALAIPLAVALDHWVFVRWGISERDAAGWKRLVAVARGIDPEPLRDRLRSTWGRRVSEVQGELHRLAESIDIRAQHPATLASLAQSLSQVQQLDSALRLLRDAQYVYPGDFWLNFDLGFALYEQKDHEGAIRYCTAAVSIRPNSAPAHNHLGMSLRGQNKVEQAIACYKKAIDLDPKFAKPYNNLGNALSDQNKVEEAIAAYRKAIEIEPKYANAYTSLGNALDAQKKLDEAIACHRKAIELAPKFAVAHDNLGVTLEHQGKVADAIAAYRKAIELDPKYAIAHNHLGVVLSGQKKLDEAIACYRKAIDLDPKYAIAYNNLGADLIEQKKLDEGIAAYRKAIELDPRFAVAHYNLGSNLRRKGLLDEAIAEYRKAIRPKPD